MTTYQVQRLAVTIAIFAGVGLAAATALSAQKGGAGSQAPARAASQSATMQRTGGAVSVSSATALAPSPGSTERATQTTAAPGPGHRRWTKAIRIVLVAFAVTAAILIYRAWHPPNRNQCGTGPCVGP